MYSRIIRGWTDRLMEILWKKERRLTREGTRILWTGFYNKFSNIKENLLLLI
jgi:hypothetical protein